MARIFITGSADGLGRAAAETLLGDGHEVIVHARSAERLAAVERAHRPRRVSRRRRPGRPGPDAGGGRPGQPARPARRGHPQRRRLSAARQILPVNVVAPYLLTALIDRPQRLVYLSSGMHQRRTSRLDRPRLERTTADRLLLRQQAASSPPSPSPWPASGPTCTATPSTPAGCRPGWADPAPPTTSGSGT